MPAKKPATDTPSDREIAIALGRSVIRDADCSGSSYCHRWDDDSDNKDRREWLLRWIDAATGSAGGDECHAIEQAGWGALDLRWTPGPIRPFIEPLVDLYLAGAYPERKAKSKKKGG